METRELYKQKYEAQLKEWGAKIVELQARVQKSAAQVQIDLKPHVEGTMTKFEQAKSRLSHIAQATDVAWDSVKHDADTSWHDFKASLDGAWAALTKPQNADGKPPA